MAEISNKSDVLDLTVTQGATFGPITCVLKDSIGNPLNITGYSFKAQIRRKPTNRLSPGCEAVCSIVNAASGEFSFSFTATDTDNLLAGNAETDEESLYQWDMQCTTPAGRVIPLAHGGVKVFRKITRNV